jgi:hypothetical protein
MIEVFIKDVLRAVQFLLWTVVVLALTVPVLLGIILYQVVNN